MSSGAPTVTASSEPAEGPALPYPAAMPVDRLGRDEFFARMAHLDEAGLRKALWTLYWRGPAAQRQRIEGLIDSPDATRGAAGSAGATKRAETARPDAGLVLAEVTEFAGLARSGAYLGRSQLVSPKERPRWRLTFRRLAQQSLEALAGEGYEAAGRAVATLVDLACETKGYDLFRSEDPMEAARLVVSDAVGALWARTRETPGAPAFTAMATRQLLRWETEFGWTRYGVGWVAERETQLATVLAGMLDSPALWAQVARDHLAALDDVDHSGKGGQGGGGGAGGRGLNTSARDRADALTTWHLMLIDHLSGTDDDDLLDRLVGHAALAGPGLSFVKARLAFDRGDLEAAGRFIRGALTSQPGNTQFRELADDIAAQRGS